MCDDQHDLGAFGTICTWIPSLWTKLSDLYPLSVDISDNISAQFKWKVLVLSESNSKSDVTDIYDDCVDAIFDKPFTAKVLVGNILAFCEHN